jgi:hypothetical protein
MWRNPNLPQPERPQPPQESGERLACFPRGQDQEQRVTLDEYQGHRYVRLQVWQLDRSNQTWWPVKGKGASIRLGEVAELAEVLASLAFRLDGEDSPAEPSRRAPAHQASRPEPAGSPQGARPAPRRTQNQAQGPAEEGRRPAPQVNASKGSSRAGFDEFGGVE